MSKIKYRSDIDGLRAIAVLSVFIFHMNSKWLPGGFLGVDVFFVISGYLITLILLKELSEKQKIDIKDFYNRRIKRILPSFYLIAIISSLAGLLILLPKDLEYFVRSLKASILIHANTHFGKLDNYFSSSSDEFPLLHTWSLSVEEQFYFFWPLLLFLINKYASPKIFIWVMTFSVLSLLSLGHIFSSDPLSQSWAYFFSLTRFAEILFGGICAYQMHHNFLVIKERSLNGLISFLGLSLVFISFIYLDKTFIYPGFWSILPCLGSYLLIFSGNFEKSKVHLLLGHPVLKWVGFHSYAIYLWHWPILAFYRYLYGETFLSVFESVLVLCITVILSACSRKFIELPFNSSKRTFKYNFIQIFLIPTLFLFTFHVIVRNLRGLPVRISNQETYENEVSFVENKYCHDSNGKVCRFGSGDKQILLFGDSIAGYYAPVLQKVIDPKIYTLNIITSARCLPILSEKPHPVSKLNLEECSKTLKAVKEILHSNHDLTLFIAGRWSNATDINFLGNAFANTIKNLRANKIYVLGTLPFFSDRDLDHYRRGKYSPVFNLLSLRNEIKEVKYNEIDPDRQKYNQFIKEECTKYRNAKFIELEKEFLTNNISIPIHMGVSLYSDGFHLNTFGAQTLASIGKQRIALLLEDL